MIDGVFSGFMAGAAVLLVVAGAGKVVDPSRTGGALRALGWGSLARFVRVGAAAEVVLGTAAVVVGGRALALMVAASYLGFALFVMAALRAGTPLGSCGCLGRADTPARARHVLVDAGLAGGAVGAAAADAPGLLDAAWIAWPVAAVVALVASGLLTGTASEAQPA